MKRRTIVTILLTLCVIVATTSCRSRKKPDPPRPMPPVVETAPEVERPAAQTVPTPDRDFVTPAAEEGDVLSADIVEANRVAHERGFLRDAFFPFDAATLDDEAQEALRATASWLRANPRYTIRVEGHCDERGTEQYNLALGDRRADAAVSFLVTLGIERDRIQTVSYGEERPFESGSSEAEWAQNRRAHIVLTGRR